MPKVHEESVLIQVLFLRDRFLKYKNTPSAVTKTSILLFIDKTEK